MSHLKVPQYLASQTEYIIEQISKHEMGGKITMTYLLVDVVKMNVIFC